MRIDSPCPVTQYYVPRFVNMEQRMQIWNRRHVAKKSNLYMEEWLTGVLVTKYDFKITLHKTHLQVSEKNSSSNANN